VSCYIMLMCNTYIYSMCMCMLHTYRQQQENPLFINIHTQIHTTKKKCERPQSINQRSSQSHTRARRSHNPAQPQRAANPAPRSAAGLGGYERMATAHRMRNSFVYYAFYSGVQIKLLGETTLQAPLLMDKRSCPGT